MVKYEVSPRYIDDSLSYLETIYSWSNRTHSRASIKEPFLIGGRGVDAYNSWFGSLDIDIIANSRTESSLRHFLKTKEGFTTEEVVPGQESIFKSIVGGGKIYVDFIGKRIPFEGKSGYTLDSRRHLSTGKHVLLRNRVRVQVPLITELWIYKLKAAWDRSFRLGNGSSNDAEWENGKLSKDFNDIVALIDAKEALDPTAVQRCFAEFPFLGEIIYRLKEDASLFSSYTRSPNANSNQIKRNLSIIEKLL